MEIAEEICLIVTKWDYFCKKILGDQLVRSVDSIAANVAEGFGRFHYRKNIHFCYYARGSLLKTISCLTKANNRKLINKKGYESLLLSLETIHKKLNGYTKYIGKLMTSDYLQANYQHYKFINIKMEGR